MIRRLFSIFGGLALLGSCLSGLFFLLVPPPAPQTWLLPAGLLLLGGLLLAKRRDWPWLPAFIGCAVLVTLAFFRPAWMGFSRNEQAAAEDGVPGLSVAVFAAGLEDPLMPAFSPAGDLYVFLPGEGRIVHWTRSVIVGPDGTLYLSDDRAGLVYRISAKTP